MKRRAIIGVAGALSMVIVSVFSIVFAPSLFAISRFTLQSGASAAQGSGQPSQLFGADGIVTTISNLLLFVVGALSVLMLIFGGLRYVVSGGNSTAVSSAKNTVLYAIVGLIVAFLAYAVINFVVGSLSGSARTDV